MKQGLSRLPAEFLKRLKKLAPPGLLPQIHQGFCESRPTTFRINTLKANGFGLIRELEQLGLICEPVKNFPDAFLLKKGSLKKLRESKPYEEGWIYLQSLSSQIPPMVLNPKPGERVLDLAAAPGGKTCQMAALMQNRGEIVAVEPHPIRFEKLVYNLKRQGVENVRPIKMAGEKIPPNPPLLKGGDSDSPPLEKGGDSDSPPLTKGGEGGFDRILLDAPCSSEGTFCVKEPQGFNHWSPNLPEEMAKKQNKLLRAAINALKPGGALVYSTCALSPEENEEVIDNALKEFPQLKILDIPLKFPFLKLPLPGWNGRTFHRDGAKARRIYPSPLMEGFFVCLLRK